MAMSVAEGIQISEGRTADAGRVLTPEALRFVALLHREFNQSRMQVLQRRVERQREIDAGVRPDFLPETREIRAAAWQVAPAPPSLVERSVEITGPVDRKMMINALNSGASVFMADFEDSLSPTWENVVAGQANLIDAVRRTLTFESEDGRQYALGERTATLLVRPRGWHLVEKHMLVDGEAVSASLFDFGLYVHHNARALLERGAGPYVYLAKLESHVEARLWNDVFRVAQRALGIPRGTVRATVLIETILAAFEMEEILYELREHASGLNAGRWDYIFSVIKKFRNSAEDVLPDRAQVTMAVPFMRAYTELLVRTCHARGAYAIGGMAAFIPSRRDAAVNETAIANVREDKEREAHSGFDGTWVAHPDLVHVAREPFVRARGVPASPRESAPSESRTTADALLDRHVPGGTVTMDGVRNNVSVALQYLDAWLRGSGAVGINNLMEDTATAEIARAQLWEWIRHHAELAEGGTVTADLYCDVRRQEVHALEHARTAAGGSRLHQAAELLDALVLSDTFVEFLTIPAYRYLDGTTVDEAHVADGGVV